MASISFTYGGDYDASNTVILTQDGLSIAYLGQFLAYYIGPYQNDRFVANNSGLESDGGAYFVISPFELLSRSNSSVYLDISENFGGVAAAGGDFADILRSGSGADTLDGGGGNDRLDGGLGADTMTGGTGNDIYVVDDAGDTVLELAGEGIDEVRTTLTGYVLADHVENLLLMGTGDLTAMGNALDNVLKGNSGANTLYGGVGHDRLDGRAGADTLVGGTGDDTYYLDNLGDSIVEVAGEGRDTAVLTVDGYVLADDVSVERLLLGSSIVSATGNNLDNVITGNAGDNVLSGGGGRDTLQGGVGKDTLIGGAGIDNLFGGVGADTFVLTATTADRDFVRDFVAAEDMIQISASAFGGGLVAGQALTAEQFVLSTTGRATSATDRFMYVESKGALYYDADGSGRAEAPQLIAYFSTNPILSAAHFDIVV